jgi:hypothetical protein
LQQHAQTTEKIKMSAAVDNPRGRPNFGRGSLLPGAVDKSTELTRPTPSLDPGNITHGVEGYDETTSGYVQCAVDAFTTAHKAIVDVINARDRLRATPTLTEDGALLKLGDYAYAKQQAATKAMDAATTRLEAGIKFLQESLSKPLQSAADNSVSAEIRSFFKSLSAEERRTRIAEAITKGDAKTVSAVLGTVPYLSGLDDAMRALYTHEWNSRAQPELATRLSVMQKSLDLVTDRAGLIFVQVELAIGGRGSWQRINAARTLHNAADDALKLA